MGRKNKLLFGIVFISLVCILFFLYIIYSNYKILDKKEFEVYFEVGNSIGFNLNETKLDFGKLNYESTSTKNIIFNNDYPYEVKLKINYKGDVNDFIYYDSEINVKQNETKKIPITIYIPNGTNYGNYSGKLIIKIKEVI